MSEVQEQIKEDAIEVSKIEEDATSTASKEDSAGVQVEEDAEVEEVVGEKQGCCRTCMRFEGRRIVQGFNILGIGRGTLLMTNMFLVTALTFLANEEAGCVEEDEEGNTVIVDDCDERAYGVIRPTSLMANVALIAGLLSAFLMPLLGAIVDYTPYRWHVGVIAAVAITIIQATQIGTHLSTWLIMAVLQAIAWFLYNVEIITTYAYLPDIAALVSEQTMTKYTSIFYTTLFSSQVVFVLSVVAISFAFSLNDVLTARVSQGLNTIILIPAFYFGWRLMPKVSPLHKIPVNPKTGKQRSVLVHGFVELWNTAKTINRDYKKGLRWFLLATVFAESALEAFSVVAVVFLTEEMELSAMEIGIFFLVGMFFMPVGTYVNYLVSSKTNPKVSYMAVIVASQACAVIGALTITKDNIVPGGYIWAVFVGLGSGWYNPAQILFFSMCTPKNGHETEFAGLFSYCLVILLWLPHLVFSSLVEAGVGVQYGLIAISFFYTIGFLLLFMSASWKEILEETRKASTLCVITEEKSEQSKLEKMPVLDDESSNK